MNLLQRNVESRIKKTIESNEVLHALIGYRSFSVSNGNVFVFGPTPHLEPLLEARLGNWLKDLGLSGRIHCKAIACNPRQNSVA